MFLELEIRESDPDDVTVLTVPIQSKINERAYFLLGKALETDDVDPIRPLRAQKQSFASA
jgi:hypothetical protein